VEKKGTSSLTGSVSDYFGKELKEEESIPPFNANQNGREGGRGSVNKHASSKGSNIFNE